MLNSLRRLFEDAIARYAGPEPAADALPLAVAALLLEVARADHAVEETERAAIVDGVARLCGVDRAAMDSLLETADEAVTEAVSFYDFTSVVNQHLSHEQKYELLVLLWRIAHADGAVHHYEDYYIRRLAELMRLSHRDFIRAKHSA